MWIDSTLDQWVRVEPEVFRPVTFGLFVAHVEPGTKLLLEDEPVDGQLWLPRHFKVQVAASVLF